MRWNIIPTDVDLLSDQRQNMVGKNVTKIKHAIQHILPNGSLNNLAHELGIDIQIVIKLSNSAVSYKQLKHVMKENQRELRMLSLDDLFLASLKDSDLDIHNIGKVFQNLQESIGQRQRDAEIKKEEDRKNRILEISTHLKVSIQQIEERWFCKIHPLNMVLVFLREKEIYEVDKIPSKNEFLRWYAQRNGLSSDPDSILSLELMLH